MNRRDLLHQMAGLAGYTLTGPIVKGLSTPSVIEPSTRRTPVLARYEQLQFGVSYHFSMNTFTGNDYETGGMPASTYNPTHLDVAQWIRVASDLGARYAVLTAKHMSGFCLWIRRDTTMTLRQVAIRLMLSRPLWRLARNMG